MWEAEETTISAPDIQLGASITRHAARQHGHLHVRTVDVAIEVERHLERVLPLVARARLDPIQIDFKVLKRLQQLAKRACAGRQVQTRRNHSRPQTGVCRRAAADARARGVGGGAEGQNCGRPGSLRISASSAIRGWSTTVCRRIIVESALSRSRAKCEPSRAVDDSARAVPANAAPEDAAGEGDDHSSGAARRPPRSAASAAILARLCCRGWKFLPEIPRVWRTSKKRGHVLLALNPRYHLFPHSCCAVA